MSDYYLDLDDIDICMGEYTIYATSSCSVYLRADIIDCLQHVYEGFEELVGCFDHYEAMDEDYYLGDALDNELSTDEVRGLIENYQYRPGLEFLNIYNDDSELIIALTGEDYRTVATINVDLLTWNSLLSVLYDCGIIKMEEKEMLWWHF